MTSNNSLIKNIVGRFKRVAFLLNRNKNHSFSISEERERRIIISGIANLFGRAIQIGVALISVPLTINYLGTERYGMMMTFMSFVGLMSFADLGLGIGLQNSIPSSTDNDKIKTNISSTFFTLLGISSLFGILFAFVYPIVSWENIVNVKSFVAIDESHYSILVLMIVFIVGLPFSIIQKINAGYQRIYLNSLWQISGNLTSLIVLLTFIYFELGTPFLILSVYGTNVFFTILNWIFFFIIKNRDLIPSLEYFSILSFKNLFHFGSIFFLLQVFTLIGNSSDSIIIAQYLGPASVAIYAVGFKLFQTLIIPVQVFLEPSWPALNEALFNKDFSWVKKTIRRNFLFAISFSTILSLFLIIFGESIVKLWIGRTIEIPFEVIFAFSILIFNANIGGSFCVILNSEKFLQFQLIISIIANTVSVGVKILFANIYSLPGIILAAPLVFFVFFYLPSYYYLRKRLSNFK